MKAEILSVGVVEDGRPVGWVFDCKGIVHPVKVATTGEHLFGGYTVAELITIAGGTGLPKMTEQEISMLFEGNENDIC